MEHPDTSGSRPAEATVGLAVFHPVVARWFRERFGGPTEIQSLAWPPIAAGRHVLVTAPTGSGKTLTAFLWSLDRLLTGSWPGGQVRVLYVSPLRALNTDIRRNLLGPLGELQEAMRAAGIAPQPVRVVTRSGDTPSQERQRMLRQPPEILITTPETLNILLTSKGGRSLLAGLNCVILDEIHAVAGSKRGTHLITGVERLTLLSGEFQRIALSATVRPAETVARFVGGFERVPSPPETDPTYRRRPVVVISSRAGKEYRFTVDSRLVVGPPDAAGAATSGSVWDPLVTDLARRISSHRSTLLFANSRRLTEKLTRLINEHGNADVAYSHHGSLSREIRAVVEDRLKQGKLAAIVATSSLELGIDVGSLDEVILIQAPPTVASAIQRTGRAGHAVGEISRGCLYPLHPRDLLDGVAIAEAIREQDIEEIRPVAAPLDVLAQVVVSMVAAEPWPIEELYGFLRTTYPYHELGRRQFDLVLEMLAGRYASSRVRELDPRLTVDRVDDTVRARRGAAALIYTSGGTIPDRGYFHLRLLEGRAKLGELDEEFVWERSVGDTFSLGAQSWQIAAITHNDVLVRPASRSSAMAPFWRAEERNRSFHLSERIGRWLEAAESVLTRRGGADSLRRQLGDSGVEEAAQKGLVRLLEEQRAATGVPLPHRHHLVVEITESPEVGPVHRQIVLHTLWGGRLNRPLALALAAAWEGEHRGPLEIEADNDCLLLLLPRGTDPMRLLQGVRADNVERLARRQLDQSGVFGARFRENAGRALLLPRGSYGKRVPLWFNRQRAKKLLSAVRRFDDFPVLLETWRTCLRDEFDLENLCRMLAELEDGEIAWSEATTTSPSPLAADIVWKRTNRLMYEDDLPNGESGSRLRHDLLGELVHSSRLRPRLPTELIDGFERKLQRVSPGYAPQGSDDLVEWVRERVAVPAPEWEELSAAIGRDAGLDGKELAEMLAIASERLVRVEAKALSSAWLVTHIEQVPRLAACFGLSPAKLRIRPLLADSGPSPPELETASPAETDILTDVVSEWIRYYGPFRRSQLSRSLGLDEERVEEVLETLAADERIVIDHFRQETGEADELEICDVENLEHLLRLLRLEARPAFEARPLNELPLFLASQQGLLEGRVGADGLMTSLEKLFGYPATARLWESDLFPARLDPYDTTWLDGLFHDTGLVWLGCGRHQTTFSLQSDLELFQDADEPNVGGSRPAAVGEIFPEEPGRFNMEELQRRTGLESAELSGRLWELAWQGMISNTTVEVLRRGVLNRFKAEVAGRPQAGSIRGRRSLTRRARFERWQAARPTAGDWFVLGAGSGAADGALDALDREELNKDRVRVLLERYGVLFRELLHRESPALQWSKLLRSLRLMELSGEVLSGRFFEGIPGLQFLSPTAFKKLQAGIPADAVYWLNAVDPASPCGLGLAGLGDSLPARRPSNHLVFQGCRLVVVSQRNGGELEVRVDPDHPRLGQYLHFLEVLLTRRFAPRRSIRVRAINGAAAQSSPYAEVLGRLFDLTREPDGLKLRRRF